MKLQLPSHNALHLSHNDLSTNLAKAVVHASRSLQQDAPSKVERSAATSTTCNSSQCKTPAQQENTTNIIIGLTVAIPVAAAIVVLFFLHRRVKRKQALEDKNDKYKSYDFGMEDVVSGKKGRGLAQPKLPEMTITDMEKATHDIGRPKMAHKGGMSLDMGSPYLLPAAVNDSRESFHSMSRSLRDGEDPYRPVAMALNSGSPVRPSSARRRYDDDSVYTASSVPSGDVMNAGLLQHASRMSRSDPDYYDHDSSPQSQHAPPFQQTVQRRPAPDVASVPSAVKNTAYPLRNASTQHNKQAPSLAINVDASNAIASHQVQIHPPSPSANHLSHAAPVVKRLSIAVTPANDEPAQDSNRLSTMNPDARRVSAIGLRPLPPDDPSDNPEQRANRIRSFYKEYFDDSKPNPTGIYPQYNPYADDYEAGYFADGAATYDPETGAFVDYAAPHMRGPAAPYADPVGRRAFTPPPGGAAPRGRNRNNMSMQSTGHINNPAFRQGPRAPPKKQLPPPVALKSLPTPHQLMQDDLAFLNPLDFAPAPTYRDERLGRGRDSPLGTMRPYSPAVIAHSPLVKSFDDLAVLPSP